MACRWVHTSQVCEAMGTWQKSHFLLSLPFSLLSPVLASVSSLPTPTYSSTTPTSRLLIESHQTVSVTMSSVAAKTLVIISGTRWKWLGGNGTF